MLDRRRNHVDLLERVLGSAQDEMPHAEVIELAIRPWGAGTTTSVVQMSVLGRGDTASRPRGSDDSNR